jgi:hypothetical protein
MRARLVRLLALGTGALVLLLAAAAAVVKNHVP